MSKIGRVWNGFGCRGEILEFGIGCRGEQLRHLELVSEIGFGLSWMPMDGLRLVHDKKAI